MILDRIWNSFSKEEFSNETIISIASTQYQLSLTERDFPLLRNYILIQTVSGYGSCHLEHPMTLEENLINKSIYDLQRTPRGIQIAALDAFYAKFKPAANEEHVLNGNNFLKVQHRTDIVIEQVKKVKDSLGKEKVLVSLLGALGSMIDRLVTLENICLKVFDKNPKIIGRKINNTSIEEYYGIDQIFESDIIIMSGMTLLDSTLDKVLVNKIKPKIILYAQTGANFIQPYMELGVTSVISEPYPFYFCSGGVSIIKVYNTLPPSYTLPRLLMD